MLTVRRTVWLVLAALLIAATALAGSGPADLQRSVEGRTFHGGPTGAGAKAARDSFMLMGPHTSGAPYIGNFEIGTKALDPSDPNLHGWISFDHTEPKESRWHVSDYMAVNGSYSAWCGDPELPSCDGGATDPDGGYGNSWNEMLEFRGTVADNAVSTIVGISAVANIFSEPGYDGTTLRAEKAGVGFVDIAYWDGVGNALSINEQVTYVPGEYLGEGADEVVLVWHFQSDGGWSDEDCSFPSSGGIQLDDVLITSNNGVGTGGVVDFEDQTFGPLAVRRPLGVGDFAKIWTGLKDEDRCAANFSRQVAFIDDGLVVPGTGGTPCQDWCYGPGGFIVNTTGGLAGPEAHIHNSVWSPVMEWSDPTHSGALLQFDVWRHEDLSHDSPGMFYSWDIRSSNTGDPADIQTAGWRSRSFVYYGGPDYMRAGYVVDDLLEPALTHLQIQLTVYELGWAWGWNGNDGTPAPYYDNVRLTTYAIVGPGMAAREIDLVQDNFPASGTIDMADPGALSVRFDGTQDISPPSHAHPAVADSFCFSAVVTREDAVLDPPVPTLHYKVKRNPVFDPYRTSALPAEGSVPCEQVVNASGLPVPDRYFGDLDDEGFLFPGDLLHYYVEAADRDTLDNSVETSILPADTTGFSVFGDPLAYHSSFTVHCLPSISDLSGSQPSLLFWNDSANRGGQDEWYTAFDALGHYQGLTYDTYYTNGPSSGVGNGLGGRATALQLDRYEVMLYTAGALSVNTISNGDVNNDSSPDAELLMTWMDTGNRNLLAFGDDLASDLWYAGLTTGQLLDDYFRVVVASRDIRDLIGGQTAPIVRTEPGQTVLNTVSSWIAYGSCPGINTFDAVTAGPGCSRIAIWTEPGGGGGSYPYAAGTVASGVGLAATSEVVYFPFAFRHIYTDPNESIPFKASARHAGRTRLLHDVLARFGIAGNPAFVSGTGVPGARFAASHYPNPFNPLVNLSFSIARPGRLTVKVFDLRGRLVRSLFDEQVTGATDLVWNGKNDHGADTASGIYFYEARMHGEVTVGKLTLVR